MPPDRADWASQAPRGASKPSAPRSQGKQGISPRGNKTEGWLLGGPPPVWGEGGLEPAVGTAFRAIINPRAKGLVRAVQLASRYASVDRSGERPSILVRRRSFICAVLEDGLQRPDARTSSTWFTKWVVTRGGDPLSIVRAEARSDAVRAALEEGAQLAPGRTIDRLFPRAVELAERTVRRKQIDLRHLLVALLERPGDSFDLLSPKPSQGELLALRAAVIEQVIKDPERGEDVDSWRAIADEFVSPEADDRLPTQTDNPAARDLLGRDTYARVLARRIRMLQVQALEPPDPGDTTGEKPAKPATRSGSRRAFMIHVHGRWGAGKSSFLQFLKTHLEKAEADSPPSMVVWFNAWEHHARRPPWWVFLSGVYRSVVSGDHETPLPLPVRLRIRARWWWWRVRSEWIPILAVLVVGLLIYKKVSLDTFAKVVTGVLALAAAVYAIGRGAVFGSKTAAEAYTKLTDDPIAPVVRLFEAIAGDLAKARRPLVVLLDDLDRCDSEFLVELLEGIQNLFKGSPVTYVAAADRDWICNAFERRYAEFAPRIGEPARPLGYLFLDKLFQISAGMPKLTAETQAVYLRSLTGGAKALEPASEEQRAEAAETMAGLSAEEDIQAEVRRIEQDGTAAEVRAAREAAAMQFTSARAEAATEKRLAALLDLMEPNPRGMKLLVNEVAMAQARGVLEGRYVQAETRARWSILSLRWPLLADALADEPSLLGIWRDPALAPSLQLLLPEALRCLAADTDIAATIGANGEAGALDEATLRDMIS